MEYLKQFINEDKDKSNKNKKSKEDKDKVILSSKDGIVERIDVKKVVKDGRELLNG